MVLMKALMMDHLLVLTTVSTRIRSPVHSMVLTTAHASHCQNHRVDPQQCLRRSHRQNHRQNHRVNRRVNRRGSPRWIRRQNHQVNHHQSRRQNQQVNHHQSRHPNHQVNPHQCLNKMRAWPRPPKPTIFCLLTQ